MDTDLAWWKFRNLQTIVHEDYDSRVDEVRAVWDDFEDSVFDGQQALEKQALDLFRDDRSAACERLTEYCIDLALEACLKADQLREQLK